MAAPNLISFASVAFTGGGAPTSHVLNTSFLTTIGDVLCVVVYLDPSNLTTPTGWTGINTVAPGLQLGKLSAWYKVAQVNGTEAVDVVSDVGAHGVGAVVTLRGVDIDNPIDDFAFYDQDNLSGNTLTVPIESLSAFDGTVIIACADTGTGRTWSIVPALTQQTSAFASETGQLVGYFNNEDGSLANPPYAATFTGAQTSGIIEAIWFRQAAISLTGGFSSGPPGVSLSTTLVASGGSAPYTYSIPIGPLPPGLGLNSTTGQISGTPTTLGSYNYTARATDSNGTTGDHAFLIVITNTPNDPPISRAPILFDSTRENFDRETGFEAFYGGVGTVWGPFRYIRGGDTDIYFVIVPNVEVLDPSCNPTAIVHVYRGSSSDGFGNWVRQDAANSPLCFAGDTDTVAFYPASENGVISILYPTLDGSTAVIDFSCVSNKFGAPSPEFTLAVPYTSPFFISRGAALFKQVSGDYWVFYSRIAAPLGVYAMKLSAGVWTGPTLILNTGAFIDTQVNASVMDPATGDMFIILTENPASLGATVCLRVNNTGTLLSNTTLPTAFTSTGRAAIWGGNKIVISYWNTPSPGTMRAVVGTPLAAPVWTDSVVDSQASSADVLFLYHDTFIDKDGNARAVWTYTDATKTPYDSGIWMSKNTGSGWLAKELVHDLVANPPSVPGYSVDYAGTNGDHTLAGIQIADGRFIFGTAIDLVGPCSPCSGFVLVTGPLPPVVPSGLRRGMSILTAKQWATIREKHLRSHMPTDIYLDHEFPNAGFHVWPVPIGTPDIEFYFWAVLTQFSALDSQIQFPPGYYDALVYNLALMLTSAYHTPVPPALLAAAEEKKRVIQELNSQIISGSYHQSRTLMGPSIGDLKPVAVTPDPNRPPQPGSAPVVTEP